MPKRFCIWVNVRKRAAVLTAAILTAAALLSSCMTACSSGTQTPQPPLASGSVIVADDTIPDSVPNMVGVVTSVTEVRDGCTLLVEVPGKNNSYTDGRVYVSVTSKTLVESAENVRFDTPGRILPGDTVSVWYSGRSTGTTPEYAVAQGILITARNTDLLLAVRHGTTTVMASPGSGEEVTASDVKPLLYGSYLLSHGEGFIYLQMTPRPARIRVSAIPMGSGSGSAGTVYHLSADVGTMTAEIPANMPPGDYIVHVHTENADNADDFIFILSVA